MRLRDLSWAAHERAIANDPDAPLLRRAWIEAPGRLGMWLAYCRPNPKTDYAWPEGTPRRDILAALSALNQPRPRYAHQILIEAGRSMGKTEMARGGATRDLLSGEINGLLVVAERSSAAEEVTSAIMATIPQYRKSERPDDALVQDYHATPLGSVYPDARWMGGQETLELSRDGNGRTDAVIWTRGIDGQLRGFNKEGIRVDRVLLDDAQTHRTAFSRAATETALAAIRGDLAGVGTPERPADLIMLANAIAPHDAADQLAASGGWRVTRGAVWSPGMPPEGEHKRRLFEILRDQGRIPEDRIRDAAAYFRAHTREILQGCRPTDPTRWANGSTDPSAPAFNLLLEEAKVGTRAFASNYQNLRLSSEAALWPMGKATWATIEGSAIRVGTRPYPLSSCHGAVWLDPRYSEDRQRNDYAAAAGVIMVPTRGGGICAVVALECERADAEQERGLYWRCVDALAEFGITSIRGGYEECGGQSKYIDPAFLADAERRTALGRRAPIPVATPSTQGKYSLDRLGRLAHPIEAGEVVFLDRLRGTEGIRLCQVLGSGDHDDAPDAIERAQWMLAQPMTWAQKAAISRGR